MTAAFAFGWQIRRTASAPQRSVLRCGPEPANASPARRSRKRIAAARIGSDEVAAAAGLSRLREQIDEIDTKRTDYTFWHDPDEAARILSRQSHWLETVSRIERLQDFARETGRRMRSGKTTRTDWARLADSLLHLEFAIELTQREVVAMGPDGHWGRDPARLRRSASGARPGTFSSNSIGIGQRPTPGRRDAA